MGANIRVSLISSDCALGVFCKGDLRGPSDLDGACIGDMVYWCEHYCVGSHLIELKTGLS